MAIDAGHLPEAPFVLAIDIGTSSTRTLLFDKQGQLIVNSLWRQTATLRTTADGGMEDDVQTAVERVISCIDGTLRQVGPLARDIGAVVMSTYVANLVGVDAEDQPITPVYLYADTRDAAEAAQLRMELDEHAIHQRTGCPLRSAYHPARLRWLERAYPELVQRVERWLSLGDYVLLHFLGQTATSLSVAAWGGLLNRHTLQWDAELLELLQLVPEQLPPLVQEHTSLVGLRSPYAMRWPDLAQVPWFVAVGDGAAANVGCGCFSPGRVALTIGTTGSLRTVTTELKTVPHGLWSYAVDREHALLGGATSEGGNVFAWLRRVLQFSEQDVSAEIEQALLQREPDRHGLTVLPFLAGERSPGWSETLPAAIVGLQLQTSALDIAQASLEAVAYRLALIARLMQPALPADVQYVGNGGALEHSVVWGQMLADVLGQPLAVASQPEPSARGAALLALKALGLGAYDDLTQLPVAYAWVYRPDSERHARYAEAIERQEALYRRLVA